jgi:hypothetical protein
MSNQFVIDNNISMFGCTQQERAIALLTTATEHYSDRTLWVRYMALVKDRDWVNQPVTPIEREYLAAYKKALNKEGWMFFRRGLYALSAIGMLVWFVFS